jgi:hypothetical protein
LKEVQGEKILKADETPWAVMSSMGLFKALGYLVNHDAGFLKGSFTWDRGCEVPFLGPRAPNLLPHS